MEDNSSEVRFISSVKSKALRIIESIKLQKQNKSHFVLIKYTELPIVKLPFNIFLITLDKLLTDTSTKIELLPKTCNDNVSKSFYLPFKQWKQLQIYGVTDNDLVKLTNRFGIVLVHCQPR